MTDGKTIFNATRVATTVNQPLPWACPMRRMIMTVSETLPRRRPFLTRQNPGQRHSIRLRKIRPRERVGVWSISRVWVYLKTQISGKIPWAIHTRNPGHRVIKVIRMMPHSTMGLHPIVHLPRQLILRLRHIPITANRNHTGRARYRYRTPFDPSVKGLLIHTSALHGCRVLPLHGSATQEKVDGPQPDGYRTNCFCISRMPREEKVRSNTTLLAIRTGMAIWTETGCIERMKMIA